MLAKLKRKGHFLSYFLLFRLGYNEMNFLALKYSY